MNDIPELTADQLEGAISARRRKRLMQGKFETGEDVTALRKFVGLTQAEFARAMGISVHTLRNWDRDGGLRRVRPSRSCGSLHVIRVSFARTCARQLESREEEEALTLADFDDEQ